MNWILIGYGLDINHTTSRKNRNEKEVLHSSMCGLVRFLKRKKEQHENLRKVKKAINHLLKEVEIGRGGELTRTSLRTSWVWNTKKEKLLLSLLFFWRMNPLSINFYMRFIKRIILSSKTKGTFLSIHGKLYFLPFWCTEFFIFIIFSQLTFFFFFKGKL